MKILNETRYYTPDLRRFVALAFKELNLGDVDKRRRVVRFAPSRRKMHWGCAAYGGDVPARRMTLTLPAPGLLDVAELWRTLRHENAHNLGLRHGEMEPALRWCLDPPRAASLALNTKAYQYGIEVPDLPAWLWGFELREKPERPAKAKPARAAIIQRKLDHARAGLKEHEQKLRREGVLVRKWRRRVGYYTLALMKEHGTENLAAAAKAASRLSGEDAVLR